MKLTLYNIAIIVFVITNFSSNGYANGDKKIRMAVLPFKGAAAPGSDLAYFGHAAQGIFTTTFSKISQLELIERERLDDISQELQRQQTDLFDPSSRVQLGKLLGVKVMLFGSYFQLGQTLRIDARMVEVETGKVLKGIEVTDESSNLFLMINELVNKFADALEKGEIISINEKERGELTELARPSYKSFPLYSDGIKLMDQARDLEKKENWKDARELYVEAQKSLFNVVHDAQNFEPAKTALRRIERKIQEIDYIIETGERIPIRVWSLIVGVNTYRDKALQPLKYAVDDAKLFFDLIKSPQCGAVPEQRIRLLLDSTATRRNIFSNLDYLLKSSSEDDLLMIYFAGHGFADEGSFYFMGVDGEQSRISATGVAASQINDMIKKMGKFKKIVWFVDACYSGASGDSGMRGVNTANEYLRELAQAENGYVILSASNEYQKALEFSDKGHGVFTYYLAEGLKGNADLPPSDGYVRIHELSEYVANKVNASTNNRQTPRCFGCDGNDLPIARVR